MSNGNSIGIKSSVAGATSATTLSVANRQRVGWTVFNDSAAIMYLDLTGGALSGGGATSTTSYSVQVPPNSFYELFQGNNNRVYVGPISAVWVSATGNARITEFT